MNLNSSLLKFLTIDCLNLPDPRLRIKEEEEDSLGIILSPQRKSFGTGCHVATANQGRHARPSSPNDADR